MAVLVVSRTSHHASRLLVRPALTAETLKLPFVRSSAQWVPCCCCCCCNLRQGEKKMSTNCDWWSFSPSRLFCPPLSESSSGAEHRRPPETDAAADAAPSENPPVNHFYVVTLLRASFYFSWFIRPIHSPENYSPFFRERDGHRTH